MSSTPRISAKGIVIHNSSLLVLYRNKRGEEYYTFPGGGVEEGESNEDAVTREMMEEASIAIVPGKLLYRVVYDGQSEQVYYLCEYIEGEPKLRDDSEEKIATDKGYNIYKPMWLPLSELPHMILHPAEVRDALLADLKIGFVGELKEFLITHHSLARGNINPASSVV